MPNITVAYRTGTIIDETVDRFRNELIDTAIDLLSTSTMPLTGKEFGIFFHEVGKWDSVEYDITVSIPLHHYPERMHNPDRLAHRFLQQLKTYFPPANELTISLSLLLCEIGWSDGEIREIPPL